MFKNAMLARRPTWFEDFFREMDHLVSGYHSDEHRFDVDVQNNDDHIVVRADVPGISKDALNVTLENGILTITGDRKREESKTEGSYYLCERSCGSYSRSFRVPADVDEKSINATLRDGVLQLILKRTPEATSRRIEIE
jgi:HSP20 family protein